mmetsp:Transcript_5780/g.14236  ORF Transcript_5780/g.14236 Transcript_5780/m.14236 type:complete len:211 (-) Transcript_5780:1092-1724(-)
MCRPAPSLFHHRLARTCHRAAPFRRFAVRQGFPRCHCYRRCLQLCFAPRPHPVFVVCPLTFSCMRRSSTSHNHPAALSSQRHLSQLLAVKHYCHDVLLLRLRLRHCSWHSAGLARALPQPHTSGPAPEPPLLPDAAAVPRWLRPSSAQQPWPHMRLLLVLCTRQPPQPRFLRLWPPAPRIPRELQQPRQLQQHVQRLPCARIAHGPAAEP